MCAVVFGEESVEAAAVAEHAQRLLCLPGRGGQHQHQHAKVLLDVRRRESLRPFQNQRPRAGSIVECLPIRMIPILQRPERLIVNLRSRHDPQHEPAIALAEVRVDQVHRLRRQQGLAAARGNLQAKRRQRLAQTISTRKVAAAFYALPSLRRPIDPELRIHPPRLRILRAQLRQRFEIDSHRLQRGLLIFLELDHREKVWRAGLHEMRAVFSPEG